MDIFKARNIVLGLLVISAIISYCAELIKMPVGAASDLGIGTVVKITGDNTISECTTGDEAVGIISAVEVYTAAPDSYVISSAGIVRDVSVAVSAVSAGDKIVPAAGGAVQPLSSDPDGNIIGTALEAASVGSSIRVVLNVMTAGGGTSSDDQTDAEVALTDWTPDLNYVTETGNVHTAISELDAAIALAGDDWGDQNVVTDATLTGNGDETPLSTVIGNTIESSEITNGTIAEVDLDVTNAPTGLDNYLLSFNEAGGDFTWIDPDAVGGVNSVTESGTTPLVISPSTGAVTIGMNVANATQDGYLTSVDWANFDNKLESGDNVSELTNDAGYLTSEVDGSVSNELITAASYTHATHTLTVTEAGADWNVDLSALDNAGTDDQTLAEVLEEGNSAGLYNINMNDNDILDANIVEMNQLRDGDGGSEIQLLDGLDVNNNYLRNTGSLYDSGVPVMDDLVPEADATYNLGSSSLGWQNIYIDNWAYISHLQMTGNINMNGNYIYNSSLTSFPDGVAIREDIVPQSDDTYSLGQSDLEWQNLYIDGTAYLDYLRMHGNIDMQGNYIWNADNIRFQAESNHIIRVNADTDDGIYYDNSANTWAWHEDGIERAYIDLDNGNFHTEGNVDVDGILYFDDANADGNLVMDEYEITEIDYLNGGATAGETGYGIRDFAGTMQYKNSGGSWSNIGGGITGSGSSNYIPLWTGTTTLGTSQLYQDGSNLGLGTTSTMARLEVEADGDGTAVRGEYDGNCYGALGYTDSGPRTGVYGYSSGSSSAQRGVWGNAWYTGSSGTYAIRGVHATANSTTGYGNLYGVTADVNATDGLASCGVSAVVHDGSFTFGPGEDVALFANADNTGGKSGLFWGGEVWIGDAGSASRVDGDGDLFVEDELEVGGGIELGGTYRTTWPTGSSPGGSDGCVQYNNSSSFGGETSLYWDDVNDRLGVGTSTPDNIIHADNGASNAYIHLESDAYAFFRAEGGSNNCGISFYNSGSAKGLIWWDPSTNYMAISSGDAVSPEMIINTSGNVGIGTTSPSGKLQVVGDEARIGDCVTTSPSTATGDGDLFVEDVLEVEGGIELNGDYITAWPSGGTDDDWAYASGSGLSGDIYHTGEISVGTSTVDPTVQGYFYNGTYSRGLIGCYGVNPSTYATGYSGGIESDTDDGQFGVFGVVSSSNPNPVGVVGIYDGTDDNGVGVWGENTESGNSGYIGGYNCAGYFNGDVGIGNSNPAAPLHVESSGGGEIARFSSYSYENPTVAIGTESSAPGLGYITLYQASGPTARVNITSHSTNPTYFNSGNDIGLGTTNPQVDLHIKQQTSTIAIRMEDYSDTDYWDMGIASTNNLWFQYNGSLMSWISYTDGSWNTSDRRLKNTIEPMDNILDKVAKLEPVTFYWNKDKVRDRKAIGLIAQDVHEQFPLAAQIEEEFGYYGINYDYISVITLQGLIELNEEYQTTIEKQQAEIESLKSEIERLNSLEERIEALENKNK